MRASTQKTKCTISLLHVGRAFKERPMKLKQPLHAKNILFEVQDAIVNRLEIDSIEAAVAEPL